MSNKNEDLKELMQKKFLLKQIAEIEKLKVEINNRKKENFKKIIIRNLKLTKLFLPHFIAMGLTTAGFLKMEYKPFSSNNYKKVYQSSMYEFDNYGQKKILRQFKNFEDISGNALDSSDNILTYTSEYVPSGDGEYTRNIKTYEISDYTFDELFDLLNSDDFKIDEHFENPDEFILETNNFLTDEEIKCGEQINATIFEKNMDIYNKEKYEEIDLLIINTLYCALIVVENVLLYAIRKSKFDYFFDYYILFENALVDNKDNKTRLKIKQENLERLKRK